MLLPLLHLSKRIGTAQVGNGIRDYACFVLWRMLRHQHPLPSNIHIHLIALCCFDPTHHVRRAASAVFIELVGRQSIPHGLDLLPHIDFFNVGNSSTAFITGQRISRVSDAHAQGLSRYLLHVIYHTIDAKRLHDLCHAFSMIYRHNPALHGPYKPDQGILIDEYPLQHQHPIHVQALI